MKDFDVIVVGGGHAGCEAANACAKMGVKTAMITMNPDRIGFMSCNPAIGGLAKGQLVKEIDALGGIMAINTDKTGIQFRRLNASKGPAVRSSRAQCDKALYASEMQKYIKSLANLTVLPVEATSLCVEDLKISGVMLRDGSKITARAVVITSGTFLQAIMHTGFEVEEGGRVGDLASNGLSTSISSLGFKLRRLKTGTPPRLHKDTIDWSVLEVQPGDEKPLPFSLYSNLDRFPFVQQLNCFITYTNEQTHKIIEENFDKSPMFTGIIKGIGPRYCPSIEDKVKRFRDKDRHQIFLEPEGLTTDEVYVNGMSTSLPRDVQEKFIRSIKGLEKADFTRHGYAVEYDSIDARQLSASLETKDIEGLFFAGQVNGTSGYEEAGAQGLIAGINAAQKILGRDKFTMDRSEGYIGVLIDDLILKGSDEPYRMFTSRAEYRLLLREDNADLRLSEKGYHLGLLKEREYQQFTKKRENIAEFGSKLKGFAVFPTAETNRILGEKNILPIKDKIMGDVFLRRTEIQWTDLCDLGFDGLAAGEDVREQIELQIKYAGYIKRDVDLIEGVRKNEMLKIPTKFNFDHVPGLSTEIRSRLKEVRPETIGQASRLQGVTPAAVASILIFLKSKGVKNDSSRV